MSYNEVFDKRLVVVDRYDKNEQMGWFDGQFQVLIKLTWKTSNSFYTAHTYLLENNELIGLGKMLAELENDGYEIVKIERFVPDDGSKGYEEIKKEDIYSYRKAKSEMR